MATVTADTTYNGWTNYETWLVNLWLTNDQGSADMLRDIVENGGFLRIARADALKEIVTDTFMPDLDTTVYGMASDLLTAALSSVNWLEIIDNHADDNA